MVQFPNLVLFLNKTKLGLFFFFFHFCIFLWWKNKKCFEVLNLLLSNLNKSSKLRSQIFKIYNKPKEISGLF